MVDDLIYGIQLPVQALSELTREPWELDATVDDLVAIARKAEATGHDFVGVCDHVAIPDNDYAAHMSTTWYDTVATLGFLAAATSTVHLLSLVWIAPYRHPLQTAKSFSTLDHLSRGRVILGVGAGHVEAEFEALGVDFHERGRMLDEAIDAVRATFGAEYASHTGSFWSFANMGICPQPVHRTLPVWIGGSGPAAWRRVGRRGDGWIPMTNPLDQLPEARSAILSEADRAGRGDHPFVIGYRADTIYVGDAPEGSTAMLTGSAEKIADALRGAVELGANALHLRFAHRSLAELLEQMDRFGDEVAPLLGPRGTGQPAASSERLTAGSSASIRTDAT